MDKDTFKSLTAVGLGIIIGVVAAKYVSKKYKENTNFSSACGACGG
jgi:hypothetical protein